MRQEALEFLSCFRCHAELLLFNIQLETGPHIIEGTLQCSQCNENYPIVRGIPRFLPTNLHHLVSHNVNNFGEQWKTYHQRLPQNQLELESYLEGTNLSLSDFEGKTILDAGCGSGKFAAITGNLPNVRLLAMDLSESVEVAFEVTRELPHVHIIQADILNPPLRSASFDLVYSIGVLHHTYDPSGSFKALSAFLKPSGSFFFWLYAKERNGLYLTLFDPIRKQVTRHLPVGMNNVMAWGLALATWPILVFYSLLSRVSMLHTTACKVLPLYEYLLYFKRVGFWLWRNTILDKMIPHISHHFSREELLSWLDGYRLNSMIFRNGNSWGVYAQKES
jgi:SAM-dependent methyltransferase